ncbi:MAG: hypothetical protein DRQ24_06270 [Candidatus Latescibacterota bacterium]|nr:MAG: hypothetical protein DRQ24_06270 [Candidatus Latescibacterota bacterium]
MNWLLMIGKAVTSDQFYITFEIPDFELNNVLFLTSKNIEPRRALPQEKTSKTLLWESASALDIRT